MKHDNEKPSNPGQNRCFAEIVEAALSRRAFFDAGIGAAAVGFFAASGIVSRDNAHGAEQESLPFSFKGVPVSSADRVIVPDDYQAVPIYAWGDPVDGQRPQFKSNAANSSEDQVRQAGMGHDGMEWFPLPEDPPERSDRGLLAMNHEYTDQGLLFQDGLSGPMTAEKVRKSQAAHGVSVIAIERGVAGAWKVVASPYSRRITANSPMLLTGPAAESKLTTTNADVTGRRVLGTINNCASGRTPWGTYLTCEENFPGVFGTDQPGFSTNSDLGRYGLTAKGYEGRLEGHSVSVYRWWQHDERFDLAKEPNEPNRFGYVVEIDPGDPDFVPRKHTALGRLKHENASVTLAADGRVVVYMGDDQANEYIYKFVSAKRTRASNGQANRTLLEKGTLYVARFAADGEGEWLELTHGKNGLTPANGFDSQADICVRTRQAADRAGATMMDRPEWVAVHRKTKEVYVTLTNNTQRGKQPPSSNKPNGSTEAGKAQPAVDSANPRPDNVYGQILRWTESNGDPAATTLTWNLFLLAGDPGLDKQVSIRGDSFGSPDGLWFDPRDQILWIQTDVSMKLLGKGPYKNLGNNMMLAADPVTGTVRRFLTGPVGCEITGGTMTPDATTMFINIQHPGDPESDISDPEKPTVHSCWPDGPQGGRPRSATVAISRKDAKPIGL